MMTEATQNTTKQVKRTLTGTVVSDKMDKTVTVLFILSLTTVPVRVRLTCFVAFCVASVIIAPPFLESAS